MSERHIRNRKRHYGRIMEEYQNSRDPEKVMNIFYPGETGMNYLIYEKNPLNIGYGLSRKPLLSEQYVGCNGIALLSGKYGVLSHYNPDAGDIYIHASRTAKAILSRNTGDETLAILIGGNRSHAETNREILMERGIRIMGEYIDGVGSENPATFKMGDYLPSKNVLVLPARQEVIVQIKLKLAVDPLLDLDSVAYIVFRRGRGPKRFL